MESKSVNWTPAHTTTTPVIERDHSIIKIHLDSCMIALKDEDGRTKSRELSLAVTKIQEAMFWIDEHMRVS